MRMEKMLLSSTPQLDKMGKLLKFAQEEGITHLSTYKTLRAKFDVNHESTKETNQIKKQENTLNNEAKKDTTFLYTTLASVRRSLHIMKPKDCNQKTPHIEALLERNTFLRRKI